MRRMIESWARLVNESHDSNGCNKDDEGSKSPKPPKTMNGQEDDGKMIGEEGEKKTREQAIDDLAKEVNRRRVRKDISDKTKKWEEGDRKKLDREVAMDTQLDNDGEPKGLSKETNDQVESGMDFLDSLEATMKRTRRLINDPEYKEINKEIAELRDQLKNSKDDDDDEDGWDEDEDDDDKENKDGGSEKKKSGRGKQEKLSKEEIGYKLRKLEKRIGEIVNDDDNKTQRFQFYVMEHTSIVRPKADIYQISKAVEMGERLPPEYRDEVIESVHDTTHYKTEAEAGAYVSRRIREIGKKVPNIDPPVSVENYQVIRGKKSGMPEKVVKTDPDAKEFLYYNVKYGGKEIPVKGSKNAPKDWVNGKLRISKFGGVHERVEMYMYSDFIIYKADEEITFSKETDRSFKHLLKIIFPEDYERLRDAYKKQKENGYDAQMKNMTKTDEEWKRELKTNLIDRITDELEKMYDEDQAKVALEIARPFLSDMKITADEMENRDWNWKHFENLDIPQLKKMLIAINPEAIKDFQDTEDDGGDVEMLSNDEIEKLSQDDKETGKKTSYHNGDRDDSETWGRGNRSNWEDYHANDDEDGSVYESEFRPEPNVAKRLVSELEDLFDRDGDVYINEEDDGIVVSVDPEDSYEDDYEYRRGQILTDVNSFLEDFNRENGTDYEAEIESENSILIY